MSDPFLSSEDYAERAHNLYSDARYDEALDVLRDGVSLYPFSPDLHLGVAYAYLAQEEYGWARRSFEQVLALDANNEEAHAGLGEVLLKLGDRSAALQYFDRVLSLGFREDHDLMLQVGRALFREGMLRHSRGFFELAVAHHDDSAEATASLGYAQHRLGAEDAALYWLRRALDLDDQYAEARIYLGNLLYDRGEYDAALFHFEQTVPEEHADELALWRTIELKKSIYRLPTTDPELMPWHERLQELAEAQDPDEQFLAEILAVHLTGAVRDPRQLELFGTLLTELQGMRRRPGDVHRISTRGGVTYAGTWEEIVLQMKMDDRDGARSSIVQFMELVARRSEQERGVVIPITDAESFVRGAEQAGIITILL